MTILMAIINMMEFSIKVASVIGSCKAVPKQAHRIFFLSNSVLLTPMVVMPNTIIVAISANGICTRIKNINPNANSIKG